MQKKERQVVDLHPSEWSRAGKPEPLLTKGGENFLVLVVALIPAFWLIGYVFTWTTESLGLGWGLVAGFAALPFIMAVGYVLVFVSTVLLLLPLRLMQRG